MGLLCLFFAASMPVLKVLLLTAVGSFLALDQINILGPDARKHLNTIGAIYLWVYVYNILRLSVQAIPEVIDSSVPECTMEPTNAEQGSLSEAQSSPIRFVRSEDRADALPSTRFDGNKHQLAFTNKIKQHAVELLGKLNLKKLFAPSTNGADGLANSYGIPELVL
ncbi:hypothetical protein AgCh_010451 [Apium graveolens]